MKRYVPAGPAVLMVLFLVADLAATGAELPEGKGKDIVESTCSECHTLDRVQAQRLDEDGWNGILREMLEAGAYINPDDTKIIVEYLARNFGPEKKLKINKAAATEIAAVLQLTNSEAESIVRYRAKYGEFKSLSDLQKVKGLAEKIEAKKALIDF
jgi:competence ComEA-like helix-hairpin-helix protein